MSEEQHDQPRDQSHDQPRANVSEAVENQRVVVVGADGMASEVAPGVQSTDEQRSVTELVDQPAKVMRIGSMIKQLLEEVRSSDLDEKSRVRLREIHTRSIKELEEGLAPELVEELDRISLPFTETEVPSEAELRVAQAQLVGWLEGLFHGIQTALFAQQMATKMALEQQGRGRPAIEGPHGQPGVPSGPLGPASGTGQYL